MTRKLKVRALQVRQPIGEFYSAVLSHRDLVDISFADMRRIETTLDRYVGIQRKLSPERVKELQQFVRSIDATFPTSIVLAIPAACAEYIEHSSTLVLAEGVSDEGDEIPFDSIAQILDGQHRIEGLKALGAEDVFELPVSIFVEADVADQAYIFATVNLAQTKVNRSLVYDLLDYANSRSPQRSCHDVAVALDKHDKSPLREMIKRLGTATPGRSGETLAQATFVNALLPFISTDALADREALARGKTLRFSTAEHAKTPFRHLWLKGRDTDIARILIEYFGAVRDRWPDAWGSRAKGNILPRTNGFRALMRLLRNVYLQLRPEDDLEKAVIPKSEYAKIFKRVTLDDSHLSVDRYPPGTSGEKRLYDELREAMKV